MKYYPEEEIVQMKQNGYESLTIEKAQLIQSRADILISEICEAFKRVKLEEGIGLNEAQGIDDYEDQDSCKMLREKDEKEDWSKISVQELNRCYSSLSFFDKKGMRFHLPAFMIADIKDQYEYGLAFNLTNLNEYSENQYSGLSPEERTVVKKFLEYMSEDEEYLFERPTIQQALVGYWSR